MCDTIAIVEDGRVLFAKNSDRDPNEAQFLDWQPRREHPAGATLRCTWIEIPQVAVTNAVLLSRPYWMWGAEIGANEHGVVIGNEAVFTNQPYAPLGLTGMDLLRLALERADSARRAVDVIVALLDAHGQGGGCGHENPKFTYHNSYIVADGHEGFVVETAGAHYAVENIHGARSISNGLTISGFASEYSDTLKTRFSSCRSRQARTRELAAGATGPADMMGILRDHGRGYGPPSYSLINGAMSAPCVHAGGLAVGSQTTASWVSELRPGAAAHWVTGTAAPCCSLFKPVQVGDPLDLGPPPNDVADDQSLWWRGERLHRLTMRDPVRLLPLFVAERDSVEAKWLAGPPQPTAAFAEGDRLLAAWTDTVTAAAGPDRRPALVRRYWARRNRRAQFDRVTIAQAGD